MVHNSEAALGYVDDINAVRAPLLDSVDNDAMKSGHMLRDKESDSDSPTPPFFAGSFTAIMYPVLLTMTMAAVAVGSLQNESTKMLGQQLKEAYVESTVGPGEAENGNMTVGQILEIAALFVGVMTAMTFVIVLCIKYGCGKLFFVYLMMSFSLVLGSIGGTVVYIVLEICKMPMDYITLVFVVHNFAIGGVLSIFWSGGINRIFNQGYLISISVLIAFLLSQIDGGYIVWGLLGALAAYDLCAVLTPCGPLNLLLKVVQNTDKGQNYLGGLLYEADVSPGCRDSREQGQSRAPRRSSTRGNHQENSSLTANKMGVRTSHGTAEEVEGTNYLSQRNLSPPVDEPRAIKLGLGDFIFYSVLVATAGKQGGYLSAMACMFTVLGGLAATLVLLVVYEKALPALPISISLGILCFVIVNFCTTPFIFSLNENEVFV